MEKIPTFFESIFSYYNSSSEFFQSIIIILVVLLILIIYTILIKNFFLNHQKNNNNNEINNDIFSLMKNTPVLKIKSLSKLTGFNIFAKLEYFSYYSLKDRIIKRILSEALNKKQINKDTNIYFASNNLSSYSLVSICHLLGLNNVTLVIPDSLPEKILKKLKQTKAKLIVTKNVDFSNFSENYIRLCKKLSSEDKNNFFIDLYQNELNLVTNFEEIAPEFYSQLNGKIDAFVCCANTGGTISGLSNYLKLKNKKCFVALVDLEKSAMNLYIKEGVFYRQEIKEEKKLVNENYGKGNCFLNNNLRKAKIDECYLCKEEEIFFVIDYLKKNDGINIGFNEGMNLVGILKMINDKRNNFGKNGNMNINIGTVFFDDGSHDCDRVKGYNCDNNINIKNIEDIYK